MRAKISFRNGRKTRLDRHPSQLAEWEGEYAEISDDDLPATLKSFVRRWRWRGKSPAIIQTSPNTLVSLVRHWRWLYADAKHSLSPQDIRATLHDLTKLSDDEIRQAVRVIDDDTECELDRATVVRWENNPEEEFPSVQEFRHEFRTGEDLRELATIALTTFPKRHGARPHILELDRIVAQSLAAWWLVNKGKPTVITGGDTNFSIFAKDIFHRVGRNLKDPSKILREAVRAVFGRPKRTITQKRVIPPNPYARKVRF